MGWGEQDEEEEQAIVRRVNEAVLIEREACAKVCDAVGDGPDNGCCPTFWNEALEKVQAAIRARSNVELSAGERREEKP